MKLSGDLTILFYQLTFDNIEFETKGNLLLLEQQISNTLVISNSKFTNLKSARITIEASNKNDISLKTKVRIVNSVFDSVDGVYNSLINTYQGADLQVQNCTFTNISKYEKGAVLNAGYQKGTVEFTDVVFQNNSASEGALFVIESESKVECHNCSISNNFAVTAAIASTMSGGYFEFYDSQIYNNYAIANPIALITEGVAFSKMNA
jgi:hypothetical protein